jgi:type IV pilus assembly protein PilC
MVRAGETAGILDEILKRLALQEEKNASIKKKIKSAMAYPMVLLFIVIVAFFGLMLFVIPSIGNIIKSLSGSDTQLPLITQVMLNISGFFVHYWYIIFAVIITSVILVRRFIKTPKGRYFLHSLMLKIPVLKAVIIKIVVARFARTFSALMGAGVPVLESLSVTANSLGNDVYRKTLLEARDKIKNGSQLSSILEDNPLFPPIVSQMLSVGEETGQTENVLVKVADFYEEEVDASINGLSSIIEPIMIVFLGTMVGLIAASVMLPIASMSQSIH